MRVSVLTGFLGAGKTTVLQHVRRELRCAFPTEKVLTIVNDVNENNIDQHAFGSPQDTNDANSVFALSGGCVCCNLLGELVNALLQAYDHGYTYVFLECTGVADSVPVVATLSALPALEGKVFVDAVITVLHAPSMWSATQRVRAREESEAYDYVLDMTTIDPLNAAQVHGANVLLVNNWESLEPVDATVMKAWKRALQKLAADANPSVRVFFTNNGGRFAFNDLVFGQDLFTKDGTRAFFLRAYADSGKHVGDLGDPNEEAGELESIGLGSFTFESTSTVVSIAALSAELTSRKGRSLLRGVWRSKGFFSAIDDQHACPDSTLPARQFRWQTVNNRFDFGEVLPPCVSLRSHSSGAAALFLTCQVVFIGKFAHTLDAKKREVELFFNSVAKDASNAP